MLLKELIPEHLFENTDFDYKANLTDKLQAILNPRSDEANQGKGR